MIQGLSSINNFNFFFDIGPRGLLEYQDLGPNLFHLSETFLQGAE